MPVGFSTLAEYVSVADGLTPTEFAARFPGTYLVAMGVLAVEMTDSHGEPRTFEMIKPFEAPRHEAGGATPLQGHVFVISGDETVTVGRDPGSDVMVPDPSVSARHAALHFSGGTATVEDTGSRNGTSINNTPIRGATELEDGDLVTFGRYSFQFFGPETFHTALRILR